MLILNVLAAVLTAWLSVQAWHRRHTTRTLYLALLSAALSLFYVALSFEGILPSVSAKLLAVKVEFLALPLIAPLFFLTALTYTRHIRRWTIALIFTVPLITIVLALTNEAHGWVWKGYTLIHWGREAYIQLTYGPWFGIHSGYSFALALGACAIFATTLQQRLPQEQMILVPIALLSAIGIIVLAIYLIYFRTSFPNPTPIFVIGISALYLYGLRIGPLYRIPPVTYPLIVEHMTDGVIVVDGHGTIIGMNPAAERMLRQPREELLGRPAQEVFATYESLPPYLNTSVPVTLRIDLETPPHGVAYEVRIIPTGDVTPVGEGYLITLHDVTERQNLERQLGRRVAHLETLQVLSEKQAPLLDTQAICQVATQTLYEISKFAHVAIYLVDEETQERVLIAAAGADERILPQRIPPGQGLSERPLLDGQLHYTPDVSIEPRYIRGLGGGSEVDAPLKVGDKVYGVLIVESEHPHAFSPPELALIEAAARQTALALERALVHQQVKEAEKRYRDLFETMPVGLYQVTVDGRLLLFNPALARILGYEPDELDRIRTPNLYIDPNDRQRWVQILSASGDDEYRSVELHLRRSDGTDIWVRNTARAIRDDSGRVLFIEGYIEDITQAVRARQVQEAFLARVERQQKAVADLLVHPAIVEGRVHEAARIINEVAVETLGLHRACVYQYAPGGQEMIALDTYDRTTGSHKHGLTVPPVRLPSTPGNPRVFVIADAQKDPRTADITAYYEDTPSPITALIAPIHLRGELVGLVSVQYVGEGREWAEDEKRFLSELADLMTQVLLSAQLHRHAEQLTTLNETLLTIASERDVNRLLNAVLEQAVALTEAEAAVLLLNEPEERKLRVAAVYNEQEDIVGQTMEYGEGAAGHVIRTGKPLLIDNYENWSHKSRFSYGRYRAVFSVPVQWGNDILGVLQVLHKEAGYFPKEIQNLIMLFARHVALALRNLHLLEQERRRGTALEALHQASLKVSAILDFQEIFPEVLRAVVALVDAYDAHIFLYDGKRLHFGSAYWAGEIRETPYAHPREDGVTYTVARTGTPLIIPNVDEHPLYQDWQWGGALASFPLKVGNTVVGVMNVAFDRPHPFTEEEVRLLELFADQAAIAIENARLVQEVQQHARDLDILRQVLQVLNSSPQIEDAFNDLGHILKRATGAKRVSLALANLNEGTFTIKALDAPREQLDVGTTMPIAATSAAEDVLSGRPHLTPDLSQELHHPGERALYEMGVRSRVNIPVKIGRKVIGALNLTWDRVNAYDESQLPLLQQVADALALGIERSRILDATRRQAKELQTLYNLSLALGSILSVKKLLERVAQELMEFVKPDSIGILRFQPDENTVEILLAYEEGERLPQLEGMRLPLEEAGLSGWVMKHGESLLIGHLEEESAKIPASPRRLTDVQVLSWLGVPLIVSERVVGALSVQSKRPYAFNENDQRFLELLGAQIALALENARLYEAERTTRESMERLFQAAQALSATLDLQEVFQRILSELRNVVPYDSASVQELREDQLVIIGGDGFPNMEELMGYTFDIDNPAHPNTVVIQTCAPLILEDAQQDYEGFRQEPHAQANIHSWLGVPMLYGDKVVGMLALDKHEPGFYTEEHARVAMAFAAQAAIAVQNARLYTETRRAAERRMILHRASQEIMQAGLDLEKICATLHRAAEQLMEFHTFTVSLVDWEREEIHAAYLYDAEGYHPSFRFPIGRGLTTYVVQRGTTLYIRDVTTHLEKLGFSPVYFGNPDPIRCILMVPMRSGDQVIGTLSVQHTRPDAYTDEDRETLETLAATAAGAVQTVNLFRKIQEQAQRVQQIVDTMPEGVVLLDGNLEVILANPRAQEFLTALAPSWQSGFLETLGDEDIYTLLHRPGDGYPHEVRTRTGRIFEISATPLGQGEALAGWVLVLREVTREREIQQRIQQHERLAAIGRLAAGIAHDFNNILQGIVGFATLLARREDIPEDARHRLRMIAQQGNRATHLVRQILDFSRASRAKREHVELCSTIREAIVWLQDLLPSNIRMVIEMPHHACPAFVDPTQIQQVLTNLVTNARDAMPDGGTLTIRLEHLHIEPNKAPPVPELRSGDWYVLSVSDTGQGIPEAILPHIFEPFFTTKDVDKGVGLGLAQVYGIVQLHDGYISVKSRVGEGTTFYIYLPAESEEHPHPPANLSKRPISL